MYRRYKSNPKAFIMTSEERVQATRLIDGTAFDIRDYMQVEYQGYDLSISLLKADLDRSIPGEDSRLTGEAIKRRIYEHTKTILIALRRGIIPDNILASALYIQLGVAHNIIPVMWHAYRRDRISSEALLEVMRQEAQDGIIRN
jgi:hypothetical protein